MPSQAHASPALAYPIDLVQRVCQLAGEASFVDDVRADLTDHGVLAAIRRHDTPTIFNWLVRTLSFQGIADRVAEGFMRDHGNVTWADIQANLAGSAPSCPKLGGYWCFSGCGYQKSTARCNEPQHFDDCCLPRHDLRNGSLNQMAYSLFLFIRDVADGDIVAWVDQQLRDVNQQACPNRLSALRAALIDPMRHVHGVSDKVLALAFSQLLIGAGKTRPLWLEVGTSFVVIDTLIHNFLHRTGILNRLQAQHLYGPGCYQPGGCSDILELVARHIDARAFNPAFPQVFPRFVQIAVWRYCGQSALDICNGNRIDDRGRCDNVYCRLSSSCDRVALNAQKAQKQELSTA